MRKFLELLEYSFFVVCSAMFIPTTFAISRSVYLMQIMNFSSMPKLYFGSMINCVEMKNLVLC